MFDEAEFYLTGS